MNLCRKISVVFLLASVAACAPAPAPPPPPPPPPPPVVVIPPRPTTPGNASLTQILPARGVDGRFVTMNSGLVPERAFWQLRIGLNVAAIGCRGAEEASMVAAYNQIVKTHAKTIRSTEKQVIGELGKASGTNGIAARDRLSTQLFNYFAQPPAQQGFCLKANEIARIVATTPSAQIIANSPAQLADLDQAFVDFYEAYAKYQVDVADWDARYGSLYAPAPQPAAQPATVSTDPQPPVGS